MLGRLVMASIGIVFPEPARGTDAPAPLVVTGNVPVRSRGLYSLPLQRDALRALRTLLLQNGTGHLSLAVELELEERPSRVLEARL